MATAHLRKAQGNKSSGVSDILNPVKGYRDELSRKGIKPKDHHRDNINLIKQKQVEIKEKHEEQKKEMSQVPFKLEKFKKVESKALKLASQKKTEDPHEFLKKNTLEKSLNEKEKERKTPVNKIKTKPPVPKSDTTDFIPSSPSSKNFITSNAAEVINATPSDKNTNEIDYMSKQDYGRVPQYILDRKVELALETEQKRRSSKTNNNGDIPPGMTVMAEDDRLKALDALRDNHEKITNELSRFPLYIETPSQKQRQNELEAKLKEIEKATAIFSRKIVYINNT